MPRESRRTSSPTREKTDWRRHLSDVSATYDALAADYDRRWRKYIERTARRTADGLALRPGDRVLDVGCGTGALLQHLGRTHAGVQLTGVDLSVRMLAVARARLGASARLVRGNAAALPFQAGRFDVVASVSALHYWLEPEAALLELRRVLKADGRMVITDWCRDFVAVRLADLYLRRKQKGYHRALGSKQMAALLEGVGCTATVERWRADLWWGLMTATAGCGS